MNVEVFLVKLVPRGEDTDDLSWRAELEHQSEEVRLQFSSAPIHRVHVVNERLGRVAQGSA